MCWYGWLAGWLAGWLDGLDGYCVVEEDSLDKVGR